MRQLVREERSSRAGVRGKQAHREEDVFADRERLGAERACGLCGHGVGMDAHPRQLDTEIALHCATHRLRKQLAGSALLQCGLDGRFPRVD
jgi:hypothetical protein